MSTESSPDLQVVSLRYVLMPCDHVTYENPPDLKFETEEARFHLAGGKLTCEMKQDFRTVDAARAVVDPILRAWEADADLRWNRRELRFKFDVADIIDRSPTPAWAVRKTALLSGNAVLVAAGTVSVHVTRDQYPAPPGSFRLTPDAKSIFDRYCENLDGREPLPSMAYFCLTVAEQLRPGGKTPRKTSKARRDCSMQYQIEEAVLNKMGELSSEHGDELSKRKASATRPLTSSERAWLEAAVKQLIWRLGDTTPPGERPLITMSDLPPL